MSTEHIYIHPPRSDYAVQTKNKTQIDLNSANWGAGQPLRVWMEIYNPLEGLDKSTEELVALIDSFDTAQLLSERRQYLYSIFLKCTEWLLHGTNHQSPYYNLIYTLRGNVRARYKMICKDMILKAKEAIVYADTHIEHYQHDEQSLRQRISRLPATISKGSREMLVNRLASFKKPIELLQSIKHKNEAVLIELNQTMA